MQQPATQKLNKEKADTIEVQSGDSNSSILLNEHLIPIPPAASEIKLHSQLGLLILILFMTAIGLSYAEHWVNPSSTGVNFPSYTINILKLLEFVLFLAGVCTVALYLGLALASLYFKIARNFLIEKDNFQSYITERKAKMLKNSSTPQSPPPSPAHHG
jgi:hypothetical protein